MEKILQQVEKNVGKGEIDCYEQFFLFPQCFQKICTADMKKPGLVWERVNFYPAIHNNGVILRRV